MQHKYGGNRRTPFFGPLPVPPRQAFLSMEVENPEELIQVLLNNPVSRSALSSFIEQTVKKNHVSTLIEDKWFTSQRAVYTLFNHVSRSLFLSLVHCSVKICAFGKYNQSGDE